LRDGLLGSGLGVHPEDPGVEVERRIVGDEDVAVGLERHAPRGAELAAGGDGRLSARGGDEHDLTPAPLIRSVGDQDVADVEHLALEGGRARGRFGRLRRHPSVAGGGDAEDGDGGDESSAE
jgi:hypothetical protein